MKKVISFLIGAIVVLIVSCGDHSCEDPTNKESISQKIDVETINYTVVDTNYTYNGHSMWRTNIYEDILIHSPECDKCSQVRRDEIETILLKHLNKEN
jgi:Phr family secreted Rap phosphatase inhibitor